MGAVGIILVLVFLALAVICAFKESKVTGPYKACKVYGRFKAYLALDFTFAGLTMAVASLIGTITGSESMKESGMYGVVSILMGLVLVALGVLLYWTSYKKCPDFLKKKCVVSMLITGLGVTMKICVFFLGFVWSVTMPQTFTTEDGNEVYVFADGDVYDPATGKTGRRTGANTVEFQV